MRIVFICLFALTGHVALAQTKLTGKIIASDGRPVAAANVLLLSVSDSSLVKGCVTNESGVYQLDRLSAGKYFVRYSAVGYACFSSAGFDLSEGDGVKEIEPATLQEAAKEMTAVVVRREAPLYQQQVDGIVVNVDKSPLTKGSTALQVLERSPGVVLDEHHGTISLNGKSGVLVMLNGKVVRMPLQQVVSLLNGMSADNIEKIELLTTPPAKYDAEGDGGMINIVLKKNKKQGTNGSFSLTGGWGYREKAAGAVNLDHNNGKVDVYGSYSYSHDRFHQNWYSYGSENVPLLGGPTTFEFWSDIHPVQNAHNVLLGLDAKIDDRTTIGVNVNYNHSGGYLRTYNTGRYTILPDSLMFLKADILQPINWNNVMASVYLEKKLSAGERITYDVEYLYYKNSSPSEVFNSLTNKDGQPIAANDSLFSPHQKGPSEITINVGVAKIDYMKQLSKGMKLEAGVKGTYTSSQGYSGIQSVVDGQWMNVYGKTSNVKMNEAIAAGYLSLNAELGPVTTLVAGVRYEYSDTRLYGAEKDVARTERKLGKLFPTIYLTHKLGDNSNIQFSYTKRISRPAYNDLASFITYLDPIAVFSGNPLLMPTITNNLKAGYNYRGYSFSVLAGRDDHPIARYQTIANPTHDLMYISPENLAYQDNLVFEAKAPFKVGAWWDMNYGFVGGFKHFKMLHTEQPAEKTYFGYQLYATETFKLPGSWTIEVSGYYNSLQYTGSIKNQGFGVVNGGVKKDLPKNAGSLSLSVSDIFKTSAIHNTLGGLTREAFDLQSYLNFNPETRGNQVFKLTYTRSFGGGSRSSREGGSRDEQDRIRKD